MTVDAIKDAISELPEGERHSLALWLNELEYDDWDKQMSQDFAPGGRGTALVDRLKRQLAEDAARPMDEGLSARENRRK